MELDRILQTQMLLVDVMELLIMSLMKSVMMEIMQMEMDVVLLA